MRIDISLILLTQQVGTDYLEVWKMHLVMDIVEVYRIQTHQLLMRGQQVMDQLIYLLLEFMIQIQNKI